jgi:5-methylcytosine-specific restriction endonuclease McrA
MTAISDSTIPPRRCTKCGEEYPATAEYFYKNKHGKYGLQAWCKNCSKAVNRTWCDTHPERTRELKQASHLRNRENNNAHSKKWLNANRARKRIAVRQYRLNNLDKIRRYDLARQKANPDKVRVRDHKRRSHKANGYHSVGDIQILLKTSLGKCWWCGKDVGNDWHLDHRIPLAKGGSNNPDNLCISCPECNRSKGAKMPHEWSDRLL